MIERRRIRMRGESLRFKSSLAFLMADEGREPRKRATNRFGESSRSPSSCNAPLFSSQDLIFHID